MEDGSCWYLFSGDIVFCFYQRPSLVQGAPAETATERHCCGGCAYVHSGLRHFQVPTWHVGGLHAINAQTLEGPGSLLCTLSLHLGQLGVPENGKTKKFASVNSEHADTPYLNKPIHHVSHSYPNNGLNVPFSIGKHPRLTMNQWVLTLLMRG